MADILVFRLVLVTRSLFGSQVLQLSKDDKELETWRSRKTSRKNIPKHMSATVAKREIIPNPTI